MIRSSFFALLALLLTLGSVSAQAQRSAAPQVRQNCSAVTAETCALAHALGRGINLGNMLEAPREGDWGVRAEPRFIDIAARHFKTVRVPVRWSNHAAPTADAKIDEAFARRVDQVIDALLARGVYVIVNMHHYSQLTGGGLHNHEFAVAPELLETRFLNMWLQIAARYKDRSPRLLFELYNEPNERLDGEPWNRLAAEALTIVRHTNPRRTVLIGPSYWNNSRDLPKLRLPKDRNLIVAIHNYDPFPFTHQGVSWRKDLRTGVRCCDAEQRRGFVESMDAASRWNAQHGVPMHLGEFGAHNAGDIQSRETHARMVRDAAEQRGFGWTYWELASDFAGVYSAETGGWVEPIRRALLD